MGSSAWQGVIGLGKNRMQSRVQDRLRDVENDRATGPAEND
jgi:hypothetical protein